MTLAELIELNDEAVRCDGDIASVRLAAERLKGDKKSGRTLWAIQKDIHDYGSSRSVTRAALESAEKLVRDQLLDIAVSSLSARERILYTRASLLREQLAQHVGGVAATSLPTI